MSDFTVYEKLRALDREARLRRVYKMKNIANGSQPSPKLEYQIKIMQEIADEYRAKWDGIVPKLDVDDGWMV